MTSGADGDVRGPGEGADGDVRGPGEGAGARLVAKAVEVAKG